MTHIVEVLRTVMPVAVMLVIGMLCRARGKLGREGIDALKNVAVNIALPAVLVKSFATTSYTLMDVLVPLLLFGVCLAAWALGRLAGRLLRLPSRFVPFLTTGFEAGMLGYALFTMLYGAENITEFARVDLGQVLFVFTAYKLLLGASGSERPAPGALVKDMLTSPIIIAIVVGVVLGATGLYNALVPSGISGIFDTCADFVAAPVSALILLCIGYDLLPGQIPWRQTLSVVALRLTILLALRLLLAALLGALWPQANLSRALNVLFILPPPFVLPVFADDPDQRVYVSSALSASTLVAIIGFAVLAALG